jgi:YHS domain-containing protein/thiol-disulfide isomerase/thioredoxin
MRPTPRSGLLLLIVWGAACAAARADAPHDGWMTDFDAALAEAQQLKRPLLIHFYTDWCGPCRQMEQNVLHRPEVLDQIRKSVVAVKLNAEKSSNIAARYAVDAFPTDVFVEPDGTRLIESEGFRSINEYRSMIARASTRYTDLVAKRTPPAVAPEKQQTQQKPPPTQLANDGPKPMLDGYCAVTLWNHRRWEKGSPQYRAEFRGQTYLLSSEAALREFNENPDRFVPRFLGCDPVVVFESDRAVLGSTRYAAFYDDELFLFVDDVNRRAFKRAPDSYVRTRVVLNVDQIETVTR